MQRSTGGNEEVPLAIDTVLDHAMHLVHTLVFGEVDVQDVRIIHV
jgi:hypothetical protein